MLKRIQTCFVILVAIHSLQVSHGDDASGKERKAADVVVYGGTSAGVVAAVQATLMDKSAILIEPGRHLGGLSSGGLGATDIGNKAAIGGMAREFYQRLGAHYGKAEAWTFEPHVAEKVFDDLVAEAKVPVFYEERLDLDGGVERNGQQITAIVMESGKRFTGHMFIDATYEGDLMAKAGVSYHVGRESNDTYGETLNGVQTKHAKYHQFKVPIDPYVVQGNPESGLLPGIQTGGPGEEGAGDHRVQAFCFRMCLTDDPANRKPFPKPKGYDPLCYELLLRYMNAGHWTVMNLSKAMPNRKTDTNNKGAFATDNIGMNYGYPDGDYATRDRIVEEHTTYQQGLMWFLANDPRVPEDIQAEINRWGLPKDEFVGTGGWPHQLYVREARRMISSYVMTEHECMGRRIAPNPVGLAAYTMDSHHVQRYVDADGYARNEGDVEVGGFEPYPIAYPSIVPKASECTNLLVPVCVSSSHIAFGSIRMEPVFMVLGQSAATAAALAIDGKTAVQDIDLEALRDRLLADKQVLAWKSAASGEEEATPPELVLNVETLDVGSRKQLFIDDLFFETAENVRLHVHPPVKTQEKSVQRDKPWESATLNWFSVIHDPASAVEKGAKYRMWYECYDVEGWPTGDDTSFCYAESHDGVEWNKPSLGLFEYQGGKTNNILFRMIGPEGAHSRVHGSCVIRDRRAPAAERYKAVSQGIFAPLGTPPHRIAGMYSADGLSWTRYADPICDVFADSQYSVFWDDALREYVLFGRVGGRGRALGRSQSPEFSFFEAPKLVLQTNENDPADSDLYNPAAMKYPHADRAYFLFPSLFQHGPQTLDIRLAVSRDGVHWSWPQQDTAFIPLGDTGAFDSGSLYMGQGLLRVGDELWQYYGTSPLKHDESKLETLVLPGNSRLYSRVVSRLDGFVSADAGTNTGHFVTPPLNFQGNLLKLNVQVRKGGSVRAGLLDEAGEFVAGRSLSDCTPITGDYIAALVRWKDGADVTAHAGRPTRLQIEMKDASLYAFQFTTGYAGEDRDH